jgi:hypothetical protein
MCNECDNTGYIEDICGYCNGSGEGLYDGSTCYQCKGKGTEKIVCECQYDDGVSSVTKQTLFNLKKFRDAWDELDKGFV